MNAYKLAASYSISFTYRAIPTLMRFGPSRHFKMKSALIRTNGMLDLDSPISAIPNWPTNPYPAADRDPEGRHTIFIDARDTRLKESTSGYTIMTKQPTPLQ